MRNANGDSLCKDLLINPALPYTFAKLIFGTSIVGLWHWGSQAIETKTKSAHRQLSGLHAVNVAGFGLLTASLLT